MKVLKLRSPGKLNLRLDVCGKRQDGYHDLRMINTMVDIYDDVEFILTDRGIEVECQPGDDPEGTRHQPLPQGEDNIAYRVSKEIMAYSNKNVGVRIIIKKNIPLAGGMGGGSSNAATVLMGLNTLLKIRLPREKLMKIGLRFGADIPFFLAGGASLAEGVGENITRLKKLPRMNFLVIYPRIQVPTKWVYERYRLEKEPVPSEEEEIPLSFSTKKALIRYMRNDLEAVTAKQFPVIKQMKEALLGQGALAAQMTGSGSSVFGIFADKEASDVAKRRLAHRHSDWAIFEAQNI